MIGKRIGIPVSITAGKVCGSVFKYSVMVFVLVISLYPMLWMLLSSFKSRMDILDSPLKLPSRLYLDGYRLVLFETPILRYFSNSVIVAAVSTFCNILIVAMAAYVIARYEFRLKKVLIAMFASTLFVSWISISYPIFRFIKLTGLYNTKTGLAITYTGLGIAVSFFILRSYILSIPREMDEAAWIDGAGNLRIFFRIILPLAKPGLATAAIITFLSSWNDFYFALLLTGGDNARTIPVTIFNFTSQFRGNMGALSASLIIIVAPTIIFYSIASEQVVKSLTAGAVKG